jgi:hypothetical protein
MRNTYKILVLKPEGKRPFRKPRRRRENNIEIDFKEIGSDIVGHGSYYEHDNLPSSPTNGWDSLGLRWRQKYKKNRMYKNENSNIYRWICTRKEIMNW